MCRDVDYLVVGSGLTGSVIARTLHDAGRSVLVLERRRHVGGNVHDYLHPSGIRVHTYGPHYFRTNSEKIWHFALRFAEFYPYEARVQTFVNGQYEPWPVAASYISRTIGTDWQPAFTGTPGNFEEASLAMMPAEVYYTFVKGYTEKQWGVPAHTLDASLAKRFEVRRDDDTRLTRSRYQGIPKLGYAGWMSQMLENVPVVLECDYFCDRDRFRPGKLLIFTGPIDQFFDYHLGRLVYRGQRRESIFHPEVEYALPCGQVNNPAPSAGAHIRTLEWKHMLDPDRNDHTAGTVLTTETSVTPGSPDQFEYPFPDGANQALYRRYREMADALDRVLICGRLGEYRYFDMDQAIARALTLANRILERGTA
jgi:UDP-galactopyranose mutase